MAAEARSWTEDPRKDPMFGVALLKIAMELKKNGGGAASAIVERVAEAMGYPPERLGAFVARNMALLVSTARNRGY